LGVHDSPLPGDSTDLLASPHGLARAPAANELSPHSNRPENPPTNGASLLLLQKHQSLPRVTSSSGPRAG